MEVINEMGKGGDVYTPDTSVSDYHEKKFKVFLEMLQDQRKYKSFMEWYILKFSNYIFCNLFNKKMSLYLKHKDHGIVYRESLILLVEPHFALLT